MEIYSLVVSACSVTRGFPHFKLKIQLKKAGKSFLEQIRVTDTVSRKIEQSKSFGSLSYGLFWVKPDFLDQFMWKINFVSFSICFIFEILPQYLISLKKVWFWLKAKFETYVLGIKVFFVAAMHVLQHRIHHMMFPIVTDTSHLHVSNLNRHRNAIRKSFSVFWALQSDVLASLLLIWLISAHGETSV